MNLMNSILQYLGYEFYYVLINSRYIISNKVKQINLNYDNDFYQLDM